MMKRSWRIPVEDHGRIAAIVIRHWQMAQRLSRYCWRRWPWLDVEDLEGEALLHLTVAAYLYRPDRGNEESFLFVHMRSRLMRFAHTLLDREPASTLLFSECVGAGERLPDWIGRELPPQVMAEEVDFFDRSERMLPEGYRNVFRLHFREGLTQAEAGRHLGVSREAVRQIVRNCVQLLKKANFSEECNGD